MLQQGKGSDLGSAFGGGSSDSLFGPLGPSGVMPIYCEFFNNVKTGLRDIDFSFYEVWILLSLKHFLLDKCVKDSNYFKASAV